MPAGASLKSKKGKKQDTVKSDLAHILGYTGTDMDPVGPPSPIGSEKEALGIDPCSLSTSWLKGYRQCSPLMNDGYGQRPPVSVAQGDVAHVHHQTCVMGNTCTQVQVH